MTDISTTDLFFAIFYLTLAILGLTLAIIVYPSLKRNSKKK